MSFEHISTAERHAGNISGVVFTARDDGYYKKCKLHRITKPLNLSANSNDIDKLNTLSSKMLGPVIAFISNYWSQHFKYVIEQNVGTSNY